MIESAEFTFPMWLEMYEEMKSHSKYYHVDPKGKLPSHSLQRYKQLADAKPRKPGEEAPIPLCTPDILEYHEKPLNRHLQLVMDAAKGIFHHKTQQLLVKLISAIQQEAISQEDQLKVYGGLMPDYQCASKLPGLEDALDLAYFLSRDGRDEPADPPTDPFYQADWICINAFCARLTAANLLHYEWAAALLCEDLINVLEESGEPHLISTFLCAAAQHVIYATANFYYYCKTRAKLGNTLKWDVWKEEFQRAREIPGLSKDAHRYSHLAVAAMERIEESDLPKSSKSFADLVAELQEKGCSEKLLKLNTAQTQSLESIRRRNVG